MIDLIKEKAKLLLSNNDGAHGYLHVERVANLSNEIQKHEGGDRLVIEAASYMHDLCAYRGREYHVSNDAMREIESVLREVHFPTDKLDRVIKAIRHHEDYDPKRRGELSIEGKILQDADRLDALGAIGIGRVFFTASSLDEPFGTPDEMSRLEEDYHVGQMTSAVRHFYTKLLNLKDSMNTEYARKLAEGRHNFMLEFLRRFKSEWSGEE